MTIDEKDLEDAARRLGAEAGARIDVRHTSTAVVERLRAAQLTPWWAAPAVLRAAAVVVLALGVGIFFRPGVRNGTEIALVPPAELQTLSDDELTEVIDSLVIEERTPTGAALSDLNERELAQLLAAMEG